MKKPCGLVLILFMMAGVGCSPCRLCADTKKKASAKTASGTTKIKKSPPAQPVSEEFFQAIAAGNIPRVEKFLADGMAVNGEKPDGDCPLVTAVESGQASMTEFLLAHGANPETRSALVLKGNILHTAVRAGNRDILALLLKKGLKVDPVNEVGETPLFLAVSNGHPQTIELLLDHGADPNKRTMAWFSPYILSQLLKDKSIRKIFLSRGIRPAPPATVHEAAADGNLSQLLRFIKVANGANARDKMGRTPLHAALSRKGKCNLETVELLLKWGAKPDLPDNEGQTPLFSAAQMSFPDISHRLLKAGASPKARNRREESLLHAAIWGDSPDLLRLFLDIGCDLNAADKEGKTPLLLAVSLGALPLADLLLKAKADVHLRNARGETPLYTAALNGNLTLVRLLLASGAKNTEDALPSGETPLQAALRLGHQDIAKILEK